MTTTKRTSTVLLLLSCLRLPSLSFAASNGDVVVIEDFGVPPNMMWYPVIDSLVDGASEGDVNVENGLAKLTGEVRTFEETSSPGFVGMQALDDYPDVSHCEGLRIMGASSDPDYTYEIAFGSNHVDAMKYGRGYKAPFKLDTTMGVTEISFIKFSDNWNELTGETNVRCEENHDYCPDADTLRNLQIMGIWAEGKNGPIDLKIKYVRAYDCVTDNDGDLFKSLVSMFGNDAPDKDKDSVLGLTESESDVLGIVGVALGGVALLLSVVAVVVARRAAKKSAAVNDVGKAVAAPETELKPTNPEDQIL